MTPAVTAIAAALSRLYAPAIAEERARNLACALQSAPDDLAEVFAEARSVIALRADLACWRVSFDDAAADALAAYALATEASHLAAFAWVRARVPERVLRRLGERGAFTSERRTA